jgi:hypothetical protein
MNIARPFKSLLVALVASAAVLGFSAPTFADKVYLKDGTVLEGTIEREGASIIVLIVKVNGKEEKRFISTSDVSKVEKGEVKPAPAPSTEPAKPEAPKPEATKPDAPKTDAPKTDAPAAKPDEKSKDGSKPRATLSRPTRVAILNFGPPSSWQGRVSGSMVGTVVNAKAWRDAIPMLEKDKVDVVVVRINSGGGLVAEMRPFNLLYQNEYKPRFRTVGWVESAISCAAMSPYVLEEFYFMSNGNLGGCTAFYGPLIAVEGAGLESIVIDMEEASRWGNRDPKIMKAMQRVEFALSANIDENGNVTWFQDMTGSNIVNPMGQILTLTAKEAVKFKFARGIADTPDDLAKVMGIDEVEWAGKEAIKFIDENMAYNDRMERHMNEYFAKYQMSVQAARALPGEENKSRRVGEVNLARRALDEMERAGKINPNIWMMNGIRPQFFTQQREMLKELAR